MLYLNNSSVPGEIQEFIGVQDSFGTVHFQKKNQFCLGKNCWLIILLAIFHSLVIFLPVTSFNSNQYCCFSLNKVYVNAFWQVIGVLKLILTQWHLSMLSRQNLAQSQSITACITIAVWPQFYGKANNNLRSEPSWISIFKIWKIEFSLFQVRWQIQDV